MHFNGGYMPSAGNTFALVEYGSESGVFFPLILPSSVSWQTTYTSTALNLTVLGTTPVLAPLFITNSVPGQPSQFVLQFTGSTNGTYNIFATTNVDLPLSNWLNLGSPSPLSNGLFEFIDPNSANVPSRFYILKSQ